MADTDHSYIYTDGQALYDVTSGNNDYTPSGYTGGLYPATTGSPEDAGWAATALIAYRCWEI